MSTVELPDLQKVPAAKDFKAVTTTKNKLVKGIKASQTIEAQIAFIQENFPAALEEYATIIFNQAGIEEEIDAEPSLNFLGRLDFKSIFTEEEERVEESQVQQTKLMSLVEKVDRTSERMMEKVEKLTKKSADKGILANIEKVIIINYS